MAAAVGIDLGTTNSVIKVGLTDGKLDISYDNPP
jgi:molecular chaperone DnaK (HSP70)